MISHLSGTIIHKSIRYVILDVNGIGYKVFCPSDTIFEIGKRNPDEKIALWTHHAVREDAEDLYGFLTKEENDFFELLISVSGIGPKTALGVLSVATIANLRKAIATGETSILTKVSGIGRKIAEKIVLELKDKIIPSEEEKTGTPEGETEAIEALISLGYSERESREALKKVPKNLSATNDILKHVLKEMGKK